MTIKIALTTILAFAGVFAIGGCAMGAIIGVVAPDYYRSAFRVGESQGFNPLQIGIGLGVTQGAAAGVAISVLILALLAWRDIRCGRAAIESESQNSDSHFRSWSVHVLWGTAAAILVLLISATTFIVGSIVGQQQLYQAWTERKLERLATILRSDDFDSLDACHSSAAQVYLTGTLFGNEVRDELHEQLTVAFGNEEAAEMIWRVDVAGQSLPN